MIDLSRRWFSWQFSWQIEPRPPLAEFAHTAARAGIGATVSLAFGAVLPAWVAIAVLFIWLLPLFWHAALLKLAAVGAIALATFAAPRRYCFWKAIGFTGLCVLEEFFLVLCIVGVGALLI